MATLMNLFRYHVNSMVSLNNRKTLQNASLNPWEFNFPTYGAKAYVWDNVEVREIRLHAGLRIIMVIKETYNANIKVIASSTINGILDILSFTTSAQCDLPRLISHITTNEGGTPVGIFFQHPDPDRTIVNGTPKTIDDKIFEAVWRSCNGHEDQGYIMLALRWFRNAIQERDEVNQFIYFWTALEIANSTLRHILKKQKGAKIGVWAPAEEVFNRKIKSVVFRDIKQARNDILHGNFPISLDFVSKIHNYVIPLKNATVYLIGSILGLNETYTDAITKNEILRLPLDASVGLKGIFENLPTDVKELLESYPELITQGKPNHYSIRDTGELDVTVSTDYKAKLPPRTIFKATGSIIVAEKNAGIMGISNTNLVDK